MKNKWAGIIAIKTERTQIHFLSDVLIAVALLNVKVPIFCGYQVNPLTKKKNNYLLNYFVYESFMCQSHSGEWKRVLTSTKEGKALTVNID